MESNKGLFIVLDGIDGSGKGTQFRLLSERLRAVGYDIFTVDIPRYEEQSSYFVRQYLQGKYGPAKNISAYTSSLFFALDRYEASAEIRKALAEGKIVLANRFTGSSMAHLGGKLATTGEQRGFFVWLDGLEFQMLGIPRPNINFVLRIPTNISRELLHKRMQASGQALDEHEKDSGHLDDAAKTYETLCQLFPKDFQAIECMENGKLLSIPEVNNKIWNVLKPMLPAKPPHAGRETVVNLNTNSAQAQPPKEEAKNIEPSNITVQIKKASLLAANMLQTSPALQCILSPAEWSEDAQYNYYVPEYLPKNLKDSYKNSMQKMADLHRELSKTYKSSSGLSPLTPLAALCDVKIEGSEESFRNLIKKLQISKFEEVKMLAVQLQNAATQLRPKTFRPLPQVKDLSSYLDLHQKQAEVQEDPVRLMEFSPRNEFNLLADILYPLTNLDHDQIQKELESWPYIKKQELLEASAPRILERASYSWSISAELSSINRLFRFIKATDLEFQPPSPLYGYETSEEIEQLNLEPIYEDCFKESLNLFNTLSEDHSNLAAYASLWGHKNRCKFNTNAEFININTSDTDAKQILSVMKEKLSEVHPIINSLRVSTKTETPPKDSNSEPKKHKHTRRRPRKNKKPNPNVD